MKEAIKEISKEETRKPIKRVIENSKNKKTNAEEPSLFDMQKYITNNKEKKCNTQCIIQL